MFRRPVHVIKNLLYAIKAQNLTNSENLYSPPETFNQLCTSIPLPVCCY
jgi:hypothetical protein